MDNKLYFYNMATREANLHTFFIAMKQDFGIDKSDMEMVVSGWEFLFDSETNTKVKVLFFDNGTQLMTVFQGDLAEDVVNIYKAFTDRFLC